MIILSEKIGIFTAMDGIPLPEGEVFAPIWQDPQEMMDATKFLTLDKGYRGTQLTVLPQGQFRFNNRLSEIEIKDALKVEVGTVAVIKAHAVEEYKPKEGEEQTVVNAVRMVPKGFRGIWNEALNPNIYYLHPDAYVVRKVNATNRVFN